MLQNMDNHAVDVAHLDARKLRRKDGPEVAVTFKVSRRAVRALAWIADSDEATVKATFARLVSAAKARADMAH